MKQTPPKRSRAARAVLALALPLLSLTLGGCGFKPLYGDYSTTPTAAAELAKISVDPISDRDGQELRIFLQDRFYGETGESKAVYHLIVKINEGRSDEAVRKDNTATRSRQVLGASFALYGPGHKPLTGGGSRAFAAFDILTEHYATVAAQRDAEERGMREIADDIQAQLIAYFSKKALFPEGTKPGAGKTPASNQRGSNQGGWNDGSLNEGSISQGSLNEGSISQESINPGSLSQSPIGQTINSDQAMPDSAP